MDEKKWIAKRTRRNGCERHPTERATKCLAAMQEPSSQRNSKHSCHAGRALEGIYKKSTVAFQNVLDVSTKHYLWTRRSGLQRGQGEMGANGIQQRGQQNVLLLCRSQVASEILNIAVMREEL